MLMLRFTLNGQTVETDLAPDTPLLWAVRDQFKLKGSKFGCGAGLCGACTMHVDGVAQKTCVLPLAAVAGKAVTTIEGLDPQGVGSAPKRPGSRKVLPVWLLPIGANYGRGPAEANPNPRKRSSKPPWPATFAAAAYPLGTRFRRRRPASRRMPFTDAMAQEVSA